MKKDGQFVEVSWDEALDFVADKLKAVKKQKGPDAIAALSSAKCTNEENYLMQKFMRGVVGTNNVTIAPDSDTALPSPVWRLFSVQAQ